MPRHVDRRLVGRAQLVGAYTRRADQIHKGLPTGEADARIAELEAELPDDIIAEARGIGREPAESAAEMSK